MTRWPILLGLAGVVVLDLLLTFENLWPTAWIKPSPRISFEVILLAAGLGLISLLRLPGGRVLRVVLTFLVFVGFVLRYIEVTAPALFGRGLNLYWDLRHLPDLLELFWRSVSAFQAALVAVAVLGTIAAVLVVVWFMLGWMQRTLRDRRLAALAVGLGVVASVLFVWSMEARYEPVRDAFAVPTARVAAAQIDFMAEAQRLKRAGPNQLREAHAPSAVPRSDLAKLQGAPVLIFFIESYGTSALDDERHFPKLAPTFRALENRLSRAGWKSVSGRLLSPTFGGRSWLAHATFLSGIRLSDQPLYNLFAGSRQETLATAFAASGYRTVLLMPGTQRYWPEGRAYGFDKIYDAEALFYTGPDFGFWRIPDQFSLQRLYDLELSGRKRPVFAMTALIMSHMPFHPLPPYVSDWGRLRAGTAYDSEETARLVAAEPDWSALSHGYVASLRYDLRILGDFILDMAPPEALIIVLGDHQPPALVAGEDKPWTVPIHVISRRGELLRPFLARGYDDGLLPHATAAAPMESFFADFLTDFASGSPEHDTVREAQR